MIDMGRTFWVMLLIAGIIIMSACSKENEQDLADAFCDTLNISFSGFVQPLMNSYCVGCHNSNNMSGNQDLSSYEGVVAASLNNKLMGAITHTPGYPFMPKD